MAKPPNVLIVGKHGGGREVIVAVILKNRAAAAGVDLNVDCAAALAERRYPVPHVKHVLSEEGYGDIEKWVSYPLLGLRLHGYHHIIAVSNSAYHELRGILPDTDTLQPHPIGSPAGQAVEQYRRTFRLAQGAVRDVLTSLQNH